MADLYLDRDWHIPEEDLEVRAVRSSGPGGQNVNKVATKVELRFKLQTTCALGPGQKRRLTQAHPTRVTREGEFVLTSDQHRSQARNRSDVLQRLAQMIRAVRHPPKFRVPTKVTQAAKKRRLDQKRHRSQLKRDRQKPRDD